MAAADLRLGSQLFFPPPGVGIVHLYRMVVLLTELNFHINEKQEILLSLSLVFDVLSFKKAVSQFHMLKKNTKIRFATRPGAAQFFETACPQSDRCGEGDGRWAAWVDGKRRKDEDDEQGSSK